jgi:EF hand
MICPAGESTARASHRRGLATQAHLEATIMNRITTLGLFATLLLSSAASAQEKQATLANADATFNELDTHKDGKLSPQEIAALKLRPDDLRGVDFDGDGFLSRDEFLLFYRQRLVAAGLKPAADLEAEATRVLAARKAKLAERGAARKLLEAKKPDTTLAPDPKALSDALDRLEEKVAAGQAKGADFDHVRDQLLAEARESDRVAQGADTALGEQSELQGKLMQAIERLRNAAANGTYSREEYRALREAFVRRARNAAKSAAGAAPAVPTSAEIAAIEQGLTEALDRLELRVTNGSVTREDFEPVRAKLIARARAAANAANAGKDKPAAEAASQTELEDKLLQSLDRLQVAAAAGHITREEYRTFRESIVQRFRNAADGGKTPAGATPEKSADLQAIEQALASALDRLEARAAAGGATREDFQSVREQFIARARAAANASHAANAADAQDPLQAQLLQSLDRLETAAQQGRFSREEYQQLRASMIHRAREIEKAGQAPTSTAAPVVAAPGANQVLDDLQKSVDGGKVSPADFRPLRDLLTKQTQALAGKTDPDSVNESALCQKLMQSLERLEKAAQDGSVDRAQFQAFRDSFIHRARNIANEVQQQPSPSTAGATNTETPSDPGAASRRTAAPPAPAQAPQAPPADVAGTPQPARDAGHTETSKVTPNDPKPAARPTSKPEDGEKGSEKPQPQPQRPGPAPAPTPAPAPDSGGKPPHALRPS